MRYHYVLSLCSSLVTFYFYIGSADWFWLRRFSLTSSQGHKAFKIAFPIFKEEPHWIRVAEYLFGDSWQQELNVVEEGVLPGEQEENQDEVGENE